jgi:nickel-dependent lactate racemase
MEEFSNIELMYGAWYGDRVISLALPSFWEIDIVGKETIRALSEEEIKKQIRSPIGTRTLCELADNKKRVCIIVDDTSRPTPAAEIIPVVLAELYSAGVKKREITIIIAGGTHQPAEEKDIEKKLGRQAIAEVKVIAHNSRGDLTYLGKTSRGTPMFVNKAVFDSEIKIGLGCIYPHPAAGFSGGSKIVAPGICGSETVRYLHDYLQGGTRGKEAGHTELKLEMDEIAGRVGLDFIVNVVLNQKREIAGLFAGDKIKAHQMGIKAAAGLYAVKKEDNADIVIADLYPFDTSLQFARDRGLWPIEGLKKHTSKVVIAACSEGLGDHELYPVTNPLKARIARRLRNLQFKEFRNFANKARALRKGLTLRSMDMMMFSTGLDGRGVASVFPRAEVFRDWNDVIRILRSRHQTSGVKVIVYRCSPFLIPQ